MSKPLLLFSLAVALVFLAPCAAVVSAQQTTAVLRITVGPTPSVSVTLDTTSRRQLPFLRSVADTGDLSPRITNLQLNESATGARVPFRTLVPGEYLAERDFSRVTYDVSLLPSKQRNAAAHVSWLKDDLGILMLADALPQLSKGPLTVSFTGDSPAVSSIDMKPDERTARLLDAENAVFYIGTGWRMRKTYRCWECPTLFLSGSWHFTDDEAASFVGDISEHYQKLFRTVELPFVQIAIAKYPARTEPGAWDAETRGRSVTIISSDMPFRTQSLQRLHEQLRHELFHLWIPNGVNLTGNYDWFYEGFALYQSLKLAVGLNRIRFEDFLDTLSRAHTIDSAGSQRISLIRASANRFSGSNTQIYARGMLVAFLTDVAMLQKSRGKRSVDDLLKDLFLKHRKPAAPADGNATVIALMKSNPELAPIVDSYVTGVEKIEWTSDLAAAGIEDIDSGPITNLRVKEKLVGRQKALLDKLGYNNWRKLSRNSR